MEALNSKSLCNKKHKQQELLTVGGVFLYVQNCQMAVSILASQGLACSLVLLALCSLRGVRAAPPDINCTKNADAKTKALFGDYAKVSAKYF